MTNIARRLFFLIALLVLVAQGTIARATVAQENTTIMVLPFQVNATEQLAYLHDDLPNLIAQRLVAKGMHVLPQSDVQLLLQKQHVRELDIATARNLAVQGKAGYALYGSFTQLGDAFSIDVRVVDALGVSAAKPYFIQKEGIINILPAVDELVDRMMGEFTSRNTISDIKIRGTRVLDPDVVLMRLAGHKGDVIDPIAINNEVKRIWNLGYFSDVQASIEQGGEGNILVYTVTEKPRIENIVIEGSDNVDKDDILTAISSKTGAVLNDKILAEDLQKVTELYRKEGFYLAKIKHSIDMQPGKPSATLLLHVEEGNKLYIKDIRIEGLEHIDADELKDLLALQERDMFSFFTGQGVLKDEMLERDSAAISAYCLNNGYVDAMVSAPQVTYEDDGIVITYVVKEGPRYKLGHVGFGGDLIDADSRLYEVIGLDEYKDSNTYFNLEVMQQDDKLLTDFYADYGYAFAEVRSTTKKHDNEAIIDVTYVINKREKAYINRIILEGNQRTRDNVILREMRLADGDLFDGAKLRRSSERLQRTRYFTQVDTEIVPTQVPGEIDLKVKVKEQNTGALMGGIGYSSYYEVGVSGTIMERNLFGRGYGVSLQGFFSKKRTSFVASFTNPRVNDSNLSLGYDAYAMRDYFDDFSKNTIGNTIRFGYPVGEYSSVGWGYRLDSYDLYDVDSDAASLIQERKGRNISSVAQARFTRDSTDSRTSPTRGSRFELSSEYGGGLLGGDDDFIKPIIEYDVYHSLTTNHILHAKAKAGAVFRNSSQDVPVFERFYIGGMNSIRGYDSSDLAPVDLFSGDEIGGDRMAFINLEYIWIFKEDMGLALVPFFDMGVNYNSDDAFNMGDELKRSVGLEMRWRSPMGDLRFAYGIPLDDARNGKDLSGKFEFTMGHFF